MKKYQAQFELKDRMSQSKASKEMVEKRRKMKQDFDTWKAGAKAEYEANKVYFLAQSDLFSRMIALRKKLLFCFFDVCNGFCLRIVLCSSYLSCNK